MNFTEEYANKANFLKVITSSAEKKFRIIVTKSISEK